LGRTGDATADRGDATAVVTSFKAVVLEGIEVVFIVLAVGAASHMIVPASLGATGAGIGVALAALALRRPLARVPENTLKLSVGVLIGSFGAFWIGEGLGFRWPGADLAILGIAGAFLVVSLLTIAVLRRTRPETFGHLGRGNASSEDADRRPSITWASRSASGRAWTTSWPPRSRASTCRPTRTSSSGAPERRHRPVRGSVFTTSAWAITMSGDSWSAAWYLGVNAPTSPERSNRWASRKKGSTSAGGSSSSSAASTAAMIPDSGRSQANASSWIRSCRNWPDVTGPCVASQARRSRASRAA